MKEFNIVLAGIGGQGTLLAAEALGISAVKDGINVRVSEIHGMAQRGGAVLTTVRIGENVLAPTVLEGQADVLLGFEPFETVRNLKYASGKTLVIMNTEEVPPIELTSKNIKYPSLDEIVQKVHSFTKKVVLIDAAQLAKKAGNSLAQNVVLLGALAGTGMLPVKRRSLIESIRELVPTKHIETNSKAFELGYESARETQKKA
jgi:indolepyruvate ferredoxin oxidoreductase beta subunit